MEMHLRTYISVIAAAFITLTGLAACDNPVEHSDENGEHAEASGILLLAGDDELVRVENAATDDTLFVPIGGETPAIDAVFLDEEGNTIHAEDLTEGFELGWQIVDTDVAGFELVADWTFTLEGLSADTTALRLELLHNDHPDLTLPDIPLVVR